MNGLFLLGFLSTALSAFTQPKLELLDSIPGKYTHFSVDNFGRIYLSNRDVMLQFSSSCDTLFSASLKQLQPTSLESSKSFRTLVFDQERSVIHFFDNTLTDIHGQIDLFNYDIRQPWLVCESFAGNTFWILDVGTMRLIKMNEKLELVTQTDNLATLFHNKTMPVQMVESNDRLYIAIPEAGVAVFDVFGTFIRMVPCKPERISVVDKYLLVRTGTVVTAIETENFFDSGHSYVLPEGATEFSFMHEKVYFLCEQALYVGRYKFE